MWRETAGRRGGRSCITLWLAPRTQCDALPDPPPQRKTVVGPSLNLRSLDSLRNQIVAKGGHVVRGEGDVIHAVGGLGIRRRTVADPLPADDIAQRCRPVRPARRKLNPKYLRRGFSHPRARWCRTTRGRCRECAVVEPNFDRERTVWRTGSASATASFFMASRF